jgi:N-acetylglutamate synthase-like GNAT family acetyltransferase
MALQLAELRRLGWPRPGREGLWVAEVDGRVAGGVTLREVADDLAQLGHLALSQEARGSGAGRRLVETVVAAAREAGYERLQLFTVSDLAAARRLYRLAGFEPKSSEQLTRWGRELDWERWELAL